MVIMEDDKLTTKEKILLTIIIVGTILAVTVWGGEIFGNCPVGRAC
jgi:hypothetical protein